MKLIFIRHGDPDYEHDSLTEKGRREAEFLSSRVSKWENIADIYVSPLGRAKETASYSLDKLNRTGIEKEWLKEFWYPVIHPHDNKPHVPWDFYPAYWNDSPVVYDKDRWTEYDLYKGVDIKKEAEIVYNGIDGILKEHGITRVGNSYISDGSFDGNLVFFCHLGVSCVMMGHILGISPFMLWHSTFLPTTSVSIVGAEIRDNKHVGFRTQVIGDTSHLLMNNEPVSHAGYFTEPFQG